MPLLPTTENILIYFDVFLAKTTDHVGPLFCYSNGTPLSPSQLTKELTIRAFLAQGAGINTADYAGHTKDVFAYMADNAYAFHLHFTTKATFPIFVTFTFVFGHLARMLM